MFPKWLHAATVSDAGKKWFTLRSLGVLYKRTPGDCAQQYKAVLHVIPRGCPFWENKANKLQNSSVTSGETEGGKH